MKICSDVGVVIIGRNEGERLKTCISSVSSIDKVVYVDSNSTDESVVYATSRGVDVLQLDMSVPFSAGRARNEGFAYLYKLYPDVKYIQFVDGDCEVIDGWIVMARSLLAGEDGLAVVCGMRRERFPEASIYNRLCDIEWDAPTGYVAASGGDFMIKAEVFSAVEGFNPGVIAGEEPEMCFRLRAQGWKIKRVAELMTLHDADMHSVYQWWLRNLRSGHAYAQGMNIHGKSQEAFNVRQVRSIVVFGGLLPILVLVAIIYGSFFMVMGILLAPALLFIKVVKYGCKEKGLSPFLGLIYGASIIAGKIPQALGIWQFYRRKNTNKPPEIIEYK